MFNRNTSVNSIRQKLFTVGLLGLLLLLLFVTRHFPDFIEQYYSQGIYTGISSTQHVLFNMLPFSMGDAAYLLLIGLFVYGVLKIVRLGIQKKFGLMANHALKLVIGIQLIVAAFYLFWGLNYFRPAIAQRLNLQDTTYTLADLKNITAMLVDSANARAKALTLADRNENNAAVYENSIKAVNELSRTNSAFHIYYPKVKPSLFTPLLNYMGTLGYYNPFTGEAQMNYHMLVFNKPVTCCHEMGHQMGYGREDEANFIGFLGGIKSGNRMLQYSAYYMAVNEFLYHLHRRDSVTYRQLKQRLSVPVKQDMKADSIYWTSYENKASIISSVFYDQFLKANNQPGGLRTYNRMIRLTMAYYRRRWMPVVIRSK